MHNKQNIDYLFKLGSTMKTNTCSTELNRIKSITPYDQKTFNTLYKVCSPLIRRLTKNIDARRLNISPDIVESFFWDKFLYIFNKYQAEQSYEHLKASLITGLKKYSYRLMRECYSKQSEFNQTLVSLDLLYDSSKEDEEGSISFLEDEDTHNAMLDQLTMFLQERLTEDEFLIYELILDPPPFLQVRIEESRGKLSILHLIDYFEFPRNRRVYNYLNQMRNKVINTLEEAKAEFGGLIQTPALASGHSEEEFME